MAKTVIYRQLQWSEKILPEYHYIYSLTSGSKKQETSMHVACGKINRVRYLIYNNICFTIPVENTYFRANDSKIYREKKDKWYEPTFHIETFSLQKNLSCCQSAVVAVFDSPNNAAPVASEILINILATCFARTLRRLHNNCSLNLITSCLKAEVKVLSNKFLIDFNSNLWNIF